MRKNQTLLVAGILLLATAVAVAQAQGIYEVIGIRAIRPGRRRRGAGRRRGAVLERGRCHRGDGHSAVFCPARGDTTPMVMRGTSDLTDTGVNDRRGGGYGHVYPAQRWYDV